MTERERRMTMRIRKHLAALLALGLLLGLCPAAVTEDIAAVGMAICCPAAAIAPSMSARTSSA